jgi:MoxR-like ATPase
MFDSIQSAIDGLAEQKYIATEEIATAVFLSLKMEKPILVEGPAGVGKTDLGRSIAAALSMDLIRLQCY